MNSNYNRNRLSTSEVPCLEGPVARPRTMGRWNQQRSESTVPLSVQEEKGKQIKPTSLTPRSRPSNLPL